ncbi:hypothetical protein U1701_11050 [Sphingomonas sp. PB2P19]|uniref:hypothetical protein n=1 Tax=Sphingomonas rhamnosi TaxID=3096156 RepID=UPI002FC6E901
MALALLDLVDTEDEPADSARDSARYRFAVDTGTNTEFEIRIGSGVVRRAGADFVEPVSFATPPRRTDGSPMGSATELAVAVAPGTDAGFAQLFSWKGGRRATTFSDVVELPRRLPPRGRPRPDGRAPPDRAPRRAVARTASLSVDPVTALAPAGVRTLSRRDFAHPNAIGFDTILDAVLKIAQPIVAEALKSPPTGAAASDPGAPAGIVAQLLRAVLGALPGTIPAPPQVAVTHSLDDARFGPGFRRPEVAQPFIFGIDDALIGAAIGQVVQILPQLANAANQKAKDRQAATNALMTEALKGINQRLMMDRIVQAQHDAQAAAAAGQPTVSPTDLAALADLAAKLQAASAAGGAAAAPLSLVRSLDTPRSIAAPASRAILEPLTGTPLGWAGGTDLLFARKGRIALRYRLTVGAPAPTRPLARAILKIVLADERNPAVRVEKEVRLKDLHPGAEIEGVFEPGELAPLPSGARLTATGALRWPGARGTPVEALGSSKIVLVGPAFVAGAPDETGPEREPVDLRRWRPFWNKLWEARAAGARGARWKLDVALRYTVAIDADQRNAVIEPRVKPPAEKPESAYDLTTGRMKAGVELGVPRLIELRQLWDLHDAPPPEQVEALGDRAFLLGLGGDFTDQVELSGKSSERGMVWAIPALRLFAVPLARVTAADAQGCVTAVEPAKIELPLPVGVRLIGLLSS